MLRSTWNWILTVLGVKKPVPVHGSMDYFYAQERYIKGLEARVKAIEDLHLQAFMDRVVLQLHLGIMEEQLKEKGITESGIKKICNTGTQGQEKQKKKRDVTNMSAAQKSTWANYTPEERAERLRVTAEGRARAKAKRLALVRK
jgi:hypothetical protein